MNLRLFCLGWIPLGLWIFVIAVGCNQATTSVEEPIPTEISTPTRTSVSADSAPVRENVAESPPALRAEPAPSAETRFTAQPGTGPTGIEAGVDTSGTSKPETKTGDGRTVLFENWPKPQVVLVFSGQQYGYLEPCGCTGLANQKGGLMRRDTFLTGLRKQGWEVVPFDVGNQVRRFGKQPEIKFQRTAEALRKMQYQAAILGTDDLKLPTLEVFSGTNDGQSPNIFVSSNVALLDRSLTPEFRVVEAGGKRIGVTGVLSDSYRKKLTGDELIHIPAEAGLTSVTKQLVAEKCDVMILLTFATLEETAQLATKFPEYQLVATAGGGGEPPLDLETIPGTKTKQVQVGAKGMFVMAIGLFDDPQVPYRTQRVPLDSRFEDSPVMLHLMEEYQEQLKAMGLEGLGLKPQPHPSEQAFVGTEKCGECHTKAYEIWKGTPHAHATDSIVTPRERSSIPRHFDPECLSCHVTGWEPQKMYPFATGYLGLDSTPLMTQNGCENCHGPGAKHVAAESGDLKVDQVELQKLRNSMKLPLANDVAKRRCIECHDIDNSPDFHDPGAFEKYWKEVEHHGKD